MIGKPKNNVRLAEILKNLNEVDILSRYLGISKLPCVINSPLRKDSNPSFGLYSKDGVHVKWRDFSTREGGSIFELLTRYWNCDLNEVVSRILTDFPGSINTTNTSKSQYRQSNSQLQCKVRPWQKHDIEYWESYGISLKWLKYAEVYPISHKIVISNGKRYVFGADNGLAATTFEYTTGTAEGDASGVAFVLEGAQKNAPLKLASWDVVKGLME